MWIWTLWAACTPSPNEDPVDPAETVRPVEVPGLEVETERVPNLLALLATATSTVPRSIRFRAKAGQTVFETPEFAVAADIPTEIPILGLFPADWSITAIVDGKDDAQWSLTTERPSNFVESPTNDLVGGFPDEEAICAAREREIPAYVCTNRTGEPTLYVPMPLDEDDEPLVAMFVRPLADGTFLAHPENSERIWHFDRLGRDLGSLTFGRLQRGTEYLHTGIDEHDSIELLEGPWAGAWAVLTYTAEEESERRGAGIIVYDPVAREVLWDWSAHGDPTDGRPLDPLRLPWNRWGVDDGHGEDWLHANAIVHGTDVDGDFFWMSFRHQDWIIEIRAPSGEISMQLGRGGDVDLLDGGPADWFYHQHAPELRRRSDREFQVLVFDNGNLRPQGEERTRIVEYLVDREAKTAVRLRDFQTDFFAEAAGDADRMPQGTGVLMTRAVGESFVAELAIEEGTSSSGERRWVQFMPREDEVYRAEFFPSLYETGWQAKTGW